MKSAKYLVVPALALALMVGVGFNHFGLRGDGDRDRDDRFMRRFDRDDFNRFGYFNNYSYPSYGYGYGLGNGWWGNMGGEREHGGDD